MSGTSATVPHEATLAVVIPAYNAAQTLEACLNAIALSVRRPDELIVFDDGSTDCTAEIARRHGARVIANARGPNGPAVGRNAGVHAARSLTVVFIDADVVVHPEAIGRLERPLLDKVAVASFGSYDERPRSRRVAAFYYNLRHHWTHQRGREEAFTFWSGLGAIDRQVFLAHGGFDVRYRQPSIEDVDLGIRVIEAGGTIRLVKDAQGSHCKDWTLRQLWQTDILRRAIPWARLIKQGRGSADDLNISISERLKTLAAHMIWLFGLVALVAPVFWLMMLAAFIVYGVLNISFYMFLARTIPIGAVLGAVVLHWFYHIYASVTFALITIWPTGKSRRDLVPHEDAARSPT